MDQGCLTGGVFLDLSKAFDLIDHSILKTKIAHVGIIGHAWHWFDNYLSGRTQSVCVNGTTSEPMDLNSGVPQGSVLGPLLFLIFINDLPNWVKQSKVVLYADDTALFFSNKDVKTIELALQEELNSLSNWSRENGLIVNCSKTNVMVFGTSQRLAKASRPVLKMSESFLPVKDLSKYLGVIFYSNLNWHGHIDTIASKVSRRLGLLSRIRKYISTDVCKQLHNSIVQPLYEYCDILWSNSDKTYLDRLLRLQKRGARIIVKRKIREVSSEQLYKELGWLPLTERWTFHKCLQVFHCINGFCPSYLLNLFSRNSDILNYNTRGRSNIHLNRILSKSGSSSFSYAAADLFNDLPNYVKNSESIRSFTSNY